MDESSQMELPVARPFEVDPAHLKIIAASSSATAMSHALLHAAREIEHLRKITAAMLQVLKTTRGNISSLGPAGALGNVYEPYTVWLQVVDDVIASASMAPTGEVK